MPRAITLFWVDAIEKQIAYIMIRYKVTDWDNGDPSNVCATMWL